MLLIVVGCSNQKGNNEAKDKEINEEKTKIYEAYFENDRPRLEKNSILYYGINQPDYHLKYITYANNSMMIETLSNYRDDENKRRICDMMQVYINEDQSKIGLMIKSGDKLNTYSSDYDPSYNDRLDILSKEQMNDLFDQAYHLEAYYNEYQELRYRFTITYKQKEYILDDESYFNREYDHSSFFEGKEINYYVEIDDPTDYNQEERINIDFDSFEKMDLDDLVTMIEAFKK